MATPVREPIEFANPPIVEVVCGAAFTTLRALRAPHLGLYWNSLRSEFPRVEEAAPLAPPPVAEMEIEFSPVPPLPRVWFLTGDDGPLIQLQKDRFIYNWKRQQTNKIYPRFAAIFPEFIKRLAHFEKFVKENELGELDFRQFELTYVNHVSSLSLSPDFGRLSDALVDHRRDVTRNRFLPEPSNFNWVTEYPLPQDMGRLHFAAQSARAIDGQVVLRLDISARGIGQNNAMSDMKEWFEVAHKWVVGGFIDATDENMQIKVWKRQPWAL